MDNSSIHQLFMAIEKTEKWWMTPQDTNPMHKTRPKTTMEPASTSDQEAQLITKAAIWITSMAHLQTMAPVSSTIWQMPIFPATLHKTSKVHQPFKTIEPTTPPKTTKWASQLRTNALVALNTWTIQTRWLETHYTVVSVQDWINPEAQLKRLVFKIILISPIYKKMVKLMRWHQNKSKMQIRIGPWKMAHICAILTMNRPFLPQIRSLTLPGTPKAPMDKLRARIASGFGAKMAKSCHQRVSAWEECLRNWGGKGNSPS